MAGRPYVKARKKGGGGGGASASASGATRTGTASAPASNGGSPPPPAAPQVAAPTAPAHAQVDDHRSASDGVSWPRPPVPPPVPPDPAAMSPRDFTSARTHRGTGRGNRPGAPHRFPPGAPLRVGPPTRGPP
ncbi:hypothetical protein AMAG_18720 [Allomyces macrogynus ATCC 38327]|uniref:Uncharacterized protein n=1 Tax=Allomyces macrogynus (strain ATCC 38327) TaxID=578462 RepID=A0A0L0SES9_ALLM3|nr:hypothetical protein AMAG_18720 [Allomyces macrogynus ATCC 38327]|eukprot:KNE60981.1 hypothetical protein AMAG_18720 [Allomyces macrogynus ATCC 38327]